MAADMRFMQSFPKFKSWHRITRPPWRLPTNKIAHVTAPQVTCHKSLLLPLSSPCKKSIASWVKGTRQCEITRAGKMQKWCNDEMSHIKQTYGAMVKECFIGTLSVAMQNSRPQVEVPGSHRRQTCWHDTCPGRRVWNTCQNSQSLSDFLRKPRHIAHLCTHSGLVANIVDHEYASGISVGVVAPVFVEMVDRQQASLPIVGNEENILDRIVWEKSS